MLSSTSVRRPGEAAGQHCARARGEPGDQVDRGLRIDALEKDAVVAQIDGERPDGDDVPAGSLGVQADRDWPYHSGEIERAVQTALPRDSLDLRERVPPGIDGPAQCRIEIAVAGIEGINGHARVHLRTLAVERPHGPLELVRDAGDL